MANYATRKNAVTSLKRKLIVHGWSHEQMDKHFIIAALPNGRYSPVYIGDVQQGIGIVQADIAAFARDGVPSSIIGL